jgi:hypothetical protein
MSSTDIRFAIALLGALGLLAAFIVLCQTG